MNHPRTYPIGAEIQPNGTHFRVWAPRSGTAAVEIYNAAGEVTSTLPLSRESGGYFSALLSDAPAGTRYRYRLETGAFADPASRSQPEGPHGPSAVVDPQFAWTDAAWTGRPARELVMYEMHLGTFTPEGTWAAACDQLEELARFGVTAIEIMPIAEAPGKFGWGYDGVNLFAPARNYGAPAAARAFVDRAHELELMVILDVVYNHFGPDGNYLAEFSSAYLSPRASEWGDGINFDGINSAPVREFYRANAAYWIAEYHFDGLRLDATHQIFDHSERHIVAEVAAAARAAAPGRTLFIVAENESQQARHARAPAHGGFGLDAIWNDDFHRAARVAATGKAEGHYLDYRGTPQEFISAAKYGFLYQGNWYGWQKKRRGTPALDLRPENFVVFLENHDQIANTLLGWRLHQLTGPGRWRALTALLLLQPAIPLLFQGQEFGASSPFLYFADHQPELAASVREGRARFLSQFRTIMAEESQGLLADPAAPDTFTRSKLDLTERTSHAAAYRLHADLLRLRREDPTFAAGVQIDGAVLGPEAFVLRYFSPDEDDRLLLVNLGAELYLNPCPEPLLAPLAGLGWAKLWSSDAPVYGGNGTPDALETAANWIIPGHAAIVLHPADDPVPPRARISEKD